MLEILMKGGPLMAFIAAAGVLALAIFLERLVSLRREKVVPQRLLNAVREQISNHKYSEAAVLCEQSRSAISVVLLTGVRNAGKTREQIKELMEETGKSVTASLERYVNAMGTIAAISPLMGLLGTVTGMIEVFQKVTTEGVGDPRVLASGIWEALITTAAGLVVAIPAYVGYRYLLGRVDRLVLEMEEISLQAADEMAKE